MGTYFTGETIKNLLGKLTYEKGVYLVLGYYAGSHYKDQVILYVTKFLGGQ